MLGFSRKIVLLLLVPVFILISAFQPRIDTSAKMKSTFLLSFTKYVEWPQDQLKEDFVIGILGDSPVSTQLAQAAATKLVLNRPMKVRRFNSASDISNCHILYIPEGFSADIEKAIGQIGDQSTLIVTEKPQFVERYSAINFVVVNYRQRFELNKKNFSKYNLKLSSQLEKLATKVIEN